MSGHYFSSFLFFFSLACAAVRRYVWVDALTNYISALGWGAGDNGSDGDLFRQFWPQAAAPAGHDASQDDATPQVGRQGARLLGER